MALFHRYAYICKPLDGGDWFSPKETWHLTDSEILKAVAGAHQKYLIGCRPARATRYAVLDIDAGSKYHNLPAVDALRNLLKQAGLEKTMVYRSSFSEGWHLYIFFEETISSRDLSKQLNQLLQHNGFDISKGNLEVFPQPGINSNGQGLRLPLQDGFAWLDQKTLEVENERFEYSPVQALELFIDALNGCANSRHQFHQLKAFVANITKRTLVEERNDVATISNVVPLATSVSEGDVSTRDEVRRIFRNIPPGINAESWLRGRSYYASGLTGPSQRADAIFCLGHYLFYGDPETKLSALGYGLEQERRRVIETLISKRHHGNSKELNRDRADAIKQVERATSWLPPSRRATEAQASAFEMPASWVRHNANLKNQTRSKIKSAVQYFLNAGQAFSGRDLSEKSKCTRATLYKHQDLWKEAYEVLQVQLLATGLHVYNAVSDLASSEANVLVSSGSEVSEFSGLFEEGLAVEDELTYRRTAKAVQRWLDPIVEVFPFEVGSFESSRLRFLVSTLSWFVSNAPTMTSKVWLESQLKKIRFVLQERASNFCVLRFDRLAFEKSRMSFRYLFGKRVERFEIARSFCEQRRKRGVVKYPPPS